MDCFRKLPKLGNAQSRCGTHRLRCEPSHEPGELFEARCVLVDIITTYPAARDQEICQSVEQGQVRLRLDGVVPRCSHRCLGLARIDHDDLRIIFVLANALPHDRMRDTQVRTDENERVGLFEILVRVRRCVEPE